MRSRSSDGELLLTERFCGETGEVVVITFNRGKQRNPLDKLTVKELLRHVRELSRDEDVRALIITGAGPAFSAGGDLKGYQQLYRDPPAFQTFMSDLFDLCAALESAPFIAVSMINGTCVAGGLEISLACDFITIAEDALIGDGHLAFAQLPGAGGSQRLVRAIGLQRARQWLLTGRLYRAEEAVEIGLAHVIAPRDELLTRTLDLVGEISRFSPTAMGAMKQLLAVSQHESSLSNGLRREQAIVFDYVVNSPDAFEGLVAFEEKRLPQYGFSRADRTGNCGTAPQESRDGQASTQRYEPSRRTTETP